MPKTTCRRCGNHLLWIWEEAFNKFGFGDGDGQVETDTVMLTLERAGYSASASKWGLHNIIIHSIKRNGVEQIPADANVGYDDPRKYLPRCIVKLLDDKLPARAEART